MDTGASSNASAAREFELHRSHLTGLAYRMLGSLAEAEDVVQEAYLRWHAADRAEVDAPRAYLARVVTRLCLDHLKSARARREHYIGPWLPEPVLDDAPLSAETAGDYAHDLSMTLMLALERLSPLERAAFLLHDVFDVDFAQVAQALGRSEAACRQLASRAREHVRKERPRFPVSPDDGARLAQAFLDAARTGDADGLARVLAEDVVLRSDGGGKRLAALAPILRRDKVTRFFVGLSRKLGSYLSYTFSPARINGQPGFVVYLPDGSVQTLALEIRNGQVAAIFIVSNPDKLQHLPREA
jgi:RNA polymerase sigma-70 factor (ECF subfamily)